jgi:hypothetical protein
MTSSSDRVQRVPTVSRPCPRTQSLGTSLTVSRVPFFRRDTVTVTVTSIETMKKELDRVPNLRDGNPS